MLSGTVDYAMYTSFREQLECAPAALAIVVRPHNEDYVFQRDHHHVGPKHQRKQAEDDFTDVAAPGRFEAFAERVDGTRANITVKDAERADQKRASHRVGNVRSLSRAYATHPQFTPYAESGASSKVSASRKKG